MKIEINDVYFKNFFSFGAREQHINLSTGINVVMGWNPDNERSNYTGKTSSLLSIPFALFGRTDKAVKKDAIVNWKNKKNCEVRLEIVCDGVPYTIVRAIKPDKFEIYRNGSLIPFSDVKSYQKMIEEEILKMDFHTFTSLIHTNLNSITPILKMTAQQKRSFLEGVFDQDKFTKVVSRINEKLHTVADNMAKLDIERERYNGQLKAINDNLTQLRKQLSTMKDSKIELNEVNEEITRLEDKYENPTLQTQHLMEKIDKSNEEISNLKREIDQRTIKLEGYKNELSRLNLDEIFGGDPRSKVNELVKIENELKNIPDDIDNEMDRCTATLQGLKDKKKEINGEISKLNIYRAECLTQLKNVEKNSSLVDKEICPLCGSKIDDSIKINYKRDVENYNNRISEIDSNIRDYQTQLENIESEIKALNNNIKDISLLQKKREKLSHDVKILRLQTSNIDSYVKMMEQRDSLKTMVDDTTKELESLQKQLIMANRINKQYNDEINDLRRIMEKLSTLREKRNILSTVVTHESDRRNEISHMIASLEGDMKTIECSINEINNKTSRYETIKVYLEYCKKLCGDDEVKQYAINAVMPYLSYKVNHYLSESGCNFYMKFTNWLEDSIFGPGVYNCTYGSLSGSESRSIDIALQLSFIDIIRKRAGRYIDTVIFDELLDSSVDSRGIISILNIIRTLQRDIDGKIFIITHRQEISDIDIDNLYIVERKNGFSNIRKA